MHRTSIQRIDRITRPPRLDRKRRVMFNNPFRERAIAESASRQQLDRLLRVTAPHERVVLVAVGLLLAGIGAWALFGAIGRPSLALLLGLDPA